MVTSLRDGLEECILAGRMMRVLEEGIVIVVSAEGSKDWI